jgi:hypothetical protein
VVEWPDQVEVVLLQPGYDSLALDGAQHVDGAPTYVGNQVAEHLAGKVPPVPV